jgi:anti-sigma B factor antagonist
LPPVGASEADRIFCCGSTRPYGDHVRVSWEPATDDSARMKVAGEVDFNNAVAVREVGMEAMSRPGCHRLAIDISEVTFLDSEAVATLVALRNTATKKGMTLVVVDLSSPVRQLFEVTGLDQVFTIEQHR